MPFEVWTRGRPKNHILRGFQTPTIDSTLCAKGSSSVASGFQYHGNLSCGCGFTVLRTCHHRLHHRQMMMTMIKVDQQTHQKNHRKHLQSRRHLTRRQIQTTAAMKIRRRRRKRRRNYRQHLYFETVSVAVISHCNLPWFMFRIAFSTVAFSALSLWHCWVPGRASGL